MKKLIAALLAILVLTLVAAFILLPTVQQPQLSLKLKANQKALLRRLIQQSLAQQAMGTPTNQLVLRPGMFEGMVLSVPLADTLHNSLLQLASLNTDSTLVTWQGVLKGGGTPWQLWHTRQQAAHLKEQVQQFMSTMHRWESDSMLYGLNIRREQVKDTTLVATRFETVQYPGTADIYSHVTQLQQYIQRNGAAVTNHPMLYVRRKPQSFEVMVGLPASRNLPNTGSMEQKRMVMGNILVAEVRGGDAVVREGMRQLEDFVSDHGLVSPAIPFVSLVTDRRQEPDSSRWVSRLYYPIL